jgi:hypothetical protein
MIQLLFPPPFRVLSDVPAFIAYVGADLKSCDPALEDPCGLNRARVRLCWEWEVDLTTSRNGMLPFVRFLIDLPCQW